MWPWYSQAIQINSFFCKYPFPKAYFRHCPFFPKYWRKANQLLENAFLPCLLVHSGRPPYLPSVNCKLRWNAMIYLSQLHCTLVRLFIRQLCCIWSDLNGHLSTAFIGLLWAAWTSIQNIYLLWLWSTHLILRIISDYCITTLSKKLSIVPHHSITFITW